jgi:tetratricopeptide (TPR) repeat protein
MYLQLGCSSKAIGDAPPASSVSPAPTGALAEADNLFAQRQDIKKLAQAVQTLESARSSGQNFEVEWKLAKYSYFLAKRTDDKADSDKLFESGRDAGKIAIRLAPDKPAGHFWYAANLGELARNNPVTVGLGAVGDIRTAMEKVIQIDPAYQNASAYDALGQIEYGTRLTSGDLNIAVEQYRKGIEVDPNNGNLYLHLAEAYVAQKKPAEAKQQIDALLKLKPDPDYAFEHTETIEKARKLLASL